ncbi:MAG TPA: N-acetyltransferase [Sphingomicrobium sp.]|nr:N-acetyltransferase [Sphingomicrobium sp.]
MTVRAADRADHAAIRDLLRAAFAGPVEADLVERLRADGDTAIELIAEAGGRVAGHILFSPMQASFRALALAPLAVAPEMQRQGIGAALIGSGHDRARQQGWDAIFVLGDPGYYARFGYSLEAAAKVVSPYSGPHFMAFPLATLPPTGGDVRHARAFATLEE